MDWIPVKHKLNSNYLKNEKLNNGKYVILVTYKTRTGIKHVKAVHCDYGRLSSKEIKEEITAFMFLPEPYEGG